MRLLAAVAVLVLIFALPCAAQADFNVSDIEKYIPQEAREALPDGLFSSEGMSDTASKFSFSYFAGLVTDVLSTAAGDSFVSLAATVGMVIAASLFHMLAAGSRTGELTTVFSSVSTLCVGVYVFGMIGMIFDSVSAYLSSLASFASAVTPVVTVAYIAGGNVSASAVSSTGLLVCIAVIEQVSAYVLYPLLSVSAVLAIASSVSSKLRIGTLAGFP